MVVGMRQTSSAVSATVLTVVPAYAPNGRSVTTASRNTIVRPASRIARAISFGVRWRFAPSTRAIIRSRNVSPGSAVIRDSFTNATPSITSPSPGMTSPSRTSTMSSRRSSDEPTSSSVPSTVRRCAVVTERVRRRLAAWARPRASAIASAYVANSTVNQSQAAICTWNPRPPPPLVGWSPVPLPSATRVTSTAVISTTNITGLRIRYRGLSLRSASGTAARMSSGSKIPRGPGAPPGARPAGSAAPRPKRWKRRVPRERSMDWRIAMLRRPFRRSGGAARRSVPARARGRTSGRRR